MWKLRRWAATCALSCTAVSAGHAQRQAFEEVERSRRFTKAIEVPVDRIRYGKRYWQTVELSTPRTIKRPPLVVLVPDVTFGVISGPYPTDWVRFRLDKSNFAVAEVSYDPGQTGPDSALSDLAKAIATTLAQAEKRGIDADHVVLLGLGSGAHFALMLATDEHYLTAAGVPFTSVVGSVSVNGDGFDIPRRIATAGAYRAGGYRRVFGRDPNAWTRLSPVSHLAPPNAPAFLFLTLREPTLALQSREMQEALNAAGASAELVDLPKFREGELSTYLLAEPKGAGDELMSFLDKVTRTDRITR